MRPSRSNSSSRSADEAWRQSSTEGSNITAARNSHKSARAGQRSDRLNRTATPLQRRGPILWFVLSLFLAGLSAGLISPLARQIGEIAPDVGSRLWIEPWRAVGEALARDGGIRATTVVFQALAARPEGPFDSRPYRQLDPDNGLYDYLSLYPELKGGNVRDELLRERIARLRSAAPARLYLARRHKAAESLFLDAACPRRVAAIAGGNAAHYLKPLHEAYPRVLREFSVAMLAQGRTWRESGHGEAAVDAHTAVVRLVIDLVTESPAPNIAMLASEVLPTAWAELERDIEALPAASSSDLTLAIAQQADRAAKIRPAWHEAADDRTNILPFTGLCYHVELAVPEHRRVMATITCSLLCIVAFLALLIVCVIWLVVTAVASNPRGVEVRWRKPRISSWLAPIIICAPCVALMILLHTTAPNYTWLFSFPSVWAVTFWPVLIPVFVGLAARLCTTSSDESLMIPLRRSGMAVIPLIVCPIIGAIIAFVTHRIGSPPPVIQVCRCAGIGLGIGSALVLACWIVSTIIRARRHRFCVFSWARGCLNVAAPALLLMTLITVTGLWLNRRADLRHQDAFVRAAADPLTDRLGPDSLARAFGGARPLLDRIEPCGRAAGVAKPSPE